MSCPRPGAAGNYAVALAKSLLEAGAADLAVAGGVDVFSRVAFAGFQRLLSLTPDFAVLLTGAGADWSWARAAGWW